MKRSSRVIELETSSLLAALAVIKATEQRRERKVERVYFP